MRVMNKSLSDRMPATLALLLSSLLIIGCMTTEEKKTLETLQQIATETPVYPKLSLIGSTNVVKRSHGSLSLFYQSPASYNLEVREYYIKELSARGWSKFEEDTYGANTEGMKFRKGEYTISVFHSSPRDQDWDYSIAYSWRP
jgi:hypothetical protein